MKRMEDNMKQKIAKGLSEALVNTVKVNIDCRIRNEYI
jgi:hypothetical protein